MNDNRQIPRSRKIEIQEVPKMRRQTHMYCMICLDVAESYSQKECYKCGSIFKWSIPWKNSSHHLYRQEIKSNPIVDAA